MTYNKDLPRFIITEDQLRLSERLGRKGGDIFIYI